MSHDHDDDYEGHHDPVDGDRGHDHDSDLATDLSDERQMDNLHRNSQSRGCLILLLAIPTVALAGLLLS